MACFVFSFFFFKQKTAYEMRISDWSSDVCSSDLHREAFQVRGDAALADAFADRAALGLQLAVGVEVVERGAHGVGEADDDVLLALAQRLGDAGEGAAGPDGADEAVDLAVGLVPDLRAGGLVVAAKVGDVVELARPDGALRMALAQLP